MSSELRLNTATVPSSSLCTWKYFQMKTGNRTKCYTWARSPSYLYSQVNFLPSHLSRTSPIALVGFANIGFRGTPGVSLHFSRMVDIPSRRAGTTKSYVGSSLLCYQIQLLAQDEWFTCKRLLQYLNLLQAEPPACLGSISSPLSIILIRSKLYHLINQSVPCSFSCRTTACARATKTERSAFPIRNFPSRLRIIYLASWPWHAARSFVMMETFFACDFSWRNQWFQIQTNAIVAHTEWPDAKAISRRLLKTYGTVRPLGLKSVFWLFFEFCTIAVS